LKALEALIGLEKLKYCFECDICTASCPIAEMLPTHYNPRILLHRIHLDEERLLTSAEPWLCAWCYKCNRRCPQGLNLPEIFRAIRKYAVEHGFLEGFTSALKRIRETIPLPASCCYICFHPERTIDDNKLIEDSIQKLIIDYETTNRKTTKAAFLPTMHKERIAIVGSGPSGLTAACELAKKGYPVTVFESLAKAGGMLRVGIPEFRLPKEVLDADIGYIKNLGVEIKINAAIGNDLMLDDLRKEYNAVLIATGMQKDKTFNIEGNDLNGVVNALDFLRQVNLGKKVKLKAKVAVVCVHRLLAIDAARVALRLEPEEVHLIYRRSKKRMLFHGRIGEQMQKEFEDAEGEGMKSHFMTWPTRIVGKNGQVVGLECARMGLGKPNEKGLRKLIPIEGSNFVIDLDSVILAVGQAPSISPSEEIELGEKNSIIVNPVTLETNLPGVYACGEIAWGPSTAIVSIASGKQAANSIDEFLRAKQVETIKI